MANINNIVNKGLLLHGIGKGVFKTVTDKVLEVTTAQTMKLNVSATSEDQYGGDSLFPLYTFISKKEGTIEITNAEFKLSQLSLAQGIDLSKTGNKRVNRVLVTKSDSNLVDGASLSGVEVIAVVAPDGSNSADVTVSSTGELTWGATAAEGEYAVWYKADDATAVKASMLKNAMPEVASFNWKFITEASDGQKYQVDIYARRTRCNGKFDMETSRDKASTPQLTVNILDPGDGKDDFAVITISKVVED
jgi:hypothetical protein